jgi:hypothetical protein
MSNAPLTIRTAGRRLHSIRNGSVICPCCYALAPRSGAAQKLRRTQRRVEAQAWRREAQAS